jgi:prepilin-type N-terminal cleavage/methylation domain-containing protein
MNTLHHWLRGRSGQGGFTLAEILVACAIISVGIMAVAAGFGMGVDGVEAGRQQSTAVFLAEQQIERAKALGMRQTGLVQLVIGTELPASEAYGSIPNAPPSYRRTTVITPVLAGVFNGKQVDVVVFYRPVTGRGVLTTERSVSLSIYLASR